MRRVESGETDEQGRDDSSSHSEDLEGVGEGEDGWKRKEEGREGEGEPRSSVSPPIFDRAQKLVEQNEKSCSPKTMYSVKLKKGRRTTTSQFLRYFQDEAREEATEEREGRLSSTTPRRQAPDTTHATSSFHPSLQAATKKGQRGKTHRSTAVLCQLMALSEIFTVYSLPASSIWTTPSSPPLDGDLRGVDFSEG